MTQGKEGMKGEAIERLKGNPLIWIFFGVMFCLLTGPIEQGVTIEQVFSNQIIFTVVLAYGSILGGMLWRIFND